MPTAVDLASAFISGYHGYVCIKGESHVAVLRNEKLNHELVFTKSNRQDVLSDARRFKEVVVVKTAAAKMLSQSISPQKFSGWTVRYMNGNAFNAGRDLGSFPMVLYPADFFKDLLWSNPTRAVLGSFDMYVTIESVSMSGTATIRLRIENKMTWKSATHLPPLPAWLRAYLFSQTWNTRWLSSEYGSSIAESEPGEEIDMSIEFTESIEWVPMDRPITPTSY